MTSNCTRCFGSGDGSGDGNDSGDGSGCGWDTN